ncbi:MAG: cysteine desulfurase [Bacteroidia bacterium]|nr:cysteine desulfurase [Bacteroidia bacterium]
MIYLDNAATSKPSREFLDAYLQIEEEFFANPASNHLAGRNAEKYLSKARNTILDSLRIVETHRVVFLASATEANNLAIKGYALKHQNRGNHIIISNVEHPSVTETVHQLRDNFGFEVTILNVNHKGQIRPEDVRQALRKTTILVSIMAVNNEIGSVNPIKEIASIVHQYSRAVFHVDTTQAISKVELPYADIDMFCVSGHKINGLKGSGALLIRKNLELLPLLSGGNQEYGLRSSTVAVAMAYTLSLAVKTAFAEAKTSLSTISSLQSFLRSFFAKEENVVINTPEKASPYIFNVSLVNKKASVVVEALSNLGIMVSSVSACHAKSETMSPAVKALGRSDELASNTLRISFDNKNTIEDVDAFIKAYSEVITRIRT